MPELPEVETVKRGLSKLIIRKKIQSVEFDTPKSFPNSASDVDTYMVGGVVTSVERRAKALFIHLDTGYSLMIHLKMTGQVVYVGKERFGAGHPNESLVQSLPDRSTRVTITFSDNTKLYFNDQRKFGWMKLLPTEIISEDSFIKKLGPEPLEPEFTGSVLYDRLQRRKNTNIKAALLDQTVLAGIGNIYADEGLWMSKIHPTTRVANLDKKHVQELRDNLVSVLQLSIEKGGSTDKNYVNAEGKKGSYIDFAEVFRREGLPCSRCSTIIEKSRVAGRGTHTCPKCQAR